ncbi:FtsK/SpoIIIE domain-containing protein [Paenisporosarcina sp.]|uniref:FtsK/SpoIIIE domain-containing protein n=1 Tax=Paenisporosarcina sp. TaxID=1932001 RepID=UPI003C764C58
MDSNKINTLTNSNFVGLWITEYIFNYLLESNKKNANKVLLKVDNISIEHFPNILDCLTESFTRIDSLYEPVIKTVRPIEGYEKFACHDHETSVWLRNFIANGQALIMLMNHKTPEAQSLKDIISVDETQLLSQKNLKSLTEMLKNQEFLSISEVNELSRFFDVYQSVIDSQLSLIVDFIVSVVKSDKQLLISEKIGENLHKLRLFNDSTLRIDNKDNLRKALRKNYLLSNLRKNNVSYLDSEKLLQSVERFIQNEQSTNYSSEVWRFVNKDEARLSQLAVNFVHRKNFDLLKIPLEQAIKLFDFKISNKIKDRLLNVKEQVLNDFQEKISQSETVEEINRLEIERLELENEFDSGLEAVLDKTDLERVRGFREEFNDYLENEGLIKTIINIENKLENPSEYTNLFEGVLSELLVLMESIEEEDLNGNLTVRLSFSQSTSMPEKYKDFWSFHLKTLSLLSKNIEFDFSTGDVYDNESLPDLISFKIEIIKNEITIGSSNFKIETSPFEIEFNSFFDFHETVLNETSLGYVIKNQQTRKNYDFTTELEELEITSNISDRKLIPHIRNFERFQADYLLLLRESLDKGLTIEILEEAKQLIDNFLSNCYADVTAVRKIYSLINKIGIVEEKVEGFGEQTKKIFSVFNPIRFIAYGYKLVHFSKLVAKLTDTTEGINNVRTIEDIHQYKTYEMSKMNIQTPAYLSTGIQDVFYFEQEEAYGQAIYVTEELQESDPAQATHFAAEMASIANDYVKVYPYASDCLDILFLYVTNLDFVKKTIETILKKNLVHKLNITIHSPSKSAVLYDELNQWMKVKEDFITPVQLLGGLPKLEINVLTHHSNQDLERKLNRSMIDYDIAVFVDYFGQRSNLKIPKNFQEVPIQECDFESDSWKVYKESGFKSNQEGTRLINYVSASQPPLMKKFYELQYVIQNGLAIQESKTAHLLKGQIQVTHTEKNALYNLVHEKFKWVVTYDRFMDPMLVNQVTNRANIIKYHINKKGKEDVKILISSSDTVKQFINRKENNYYHSRLGNRLKDLLSTKSINHEVVADIIHKVKELSGGSVLRSLGPGKFIHELLSVYLTVSNNIKKDDTVVVWGMCDELEWFRKNQKRPDLLNVEITFNKENALISINFKLIELKLIHYNSYETEIIDAEKQLKNGEKALRAFFENEDQSLDREMRLQSLISYLIEARTYTNIEKGILDQLLNASPSNVNFTFEKEINAYIYSQDIQFDSKDQISSGEYVNYSTSDLTLKTFTRSYILERLKAEDIENLVNHEIKEEEETNFNTYFNRTHEIEVEKISDPSNQEDFAISEENVSKDEDPSINIEEANSIPKLIDEVPSTEEVESTEPREITTLFPEKIALNQIEVNLDQESNEIEKQLGELYGKTIRGKLHYNNINFTVEKTIVGANVIRVIGSIPPDQSLSSLEKKAKDMALWLRIDNTPNIFNDKNGINIDINRENPEIIQFNKFMELVREQINAKIIRESFIVPIGLDPLNQVMAVDFSGTEPHMLVAGSTGSGKSVSLNSIVLSLMCLYTPKELEFVFIDPKQVEFSVFEGTKHTRKVLYSIDDSAEYLDQMINEMENRYNLFKKEIVKNLNEFNDLMSKRGNDEKVLPRLVIVFDEFADFMMQEKQFAKRIENTISRIGQKGRAAGLHMIVCTQSPKAEIINTTIKNNLLARLALKVTDNTASNVVLDNSGAEKLAGKGDYLLKTSGDPARGKSPYLNSDVYRALLEFFRGDF